MNKIAFLYSEESKRSKYLINILKEDYEILFVRSLEGTMSLFERSFDSLSAFIIDRPATKKYVEKIIEYVDKRNSFMFTLPILLLTDYKSIEEDDKYLSDNVVGMITEGESKRTVLRRIENTIRFSNSASFDDFSNMLKVLPSLIYLKDVTGRYAFCSHHWHHLKPSYESIRGLTDYDIRKNADNARIAQESDMKVVSTGQGMTYIIKEDDDEGVDYLQIIKEPVRNEKGEVRGIIAIINNVTEEELLRQELRKKSITDQLTGLYNRVYYEELLESYKDKFEIPLTIISADCDALKKINDKYGHAAGDKYICFARDALLDTLPEDACIFRMGGDEFLAIIPNMDKYEAAKTVKELIKNSKKYKTSQFELKLSAGCYTITRKNISIETAVILSDKEMYKMKKRCR